MAPGKNLASLRHIIMIAAQTFDSSRFIFAVVSIQALQSGTD
jgi:hypothetical protein